MSSRVVFAVCAVVILVSYLLLESNPEDDRETQPYINSIIVEQKVDVLEDSNGMQITEKENIETPGTNTNDSLVIENLNPKQLELYNKFLDMLTRGETSDWVQFLNKADEKALFNRGSYNLSLLHAIDIGAPEEVLYALLARGAELSPSHTHQLVARGDIGLLKTFENFGLDIHEVNPTTGKNALVMAMQDPRKTEMFDYLLERNLSTKTSYDMLGFAMGMAKDFKQADHFVIGLAKNGAPITSETHNWLLSLRETNPQEYLRLARIINKNR
jgi:hypothetical protein